MFGVAVGTTSSVLMAPWDTEFGVKVGLLSGLVVVCAARRLSTAAAAARLGGGPPLAHGSVNW